MYRKGYLIDIFSLLVHFTSVFTGQASASHPEMPMKSVFFSSKKAVRHLTFVTHLTSLLLTGDSQGCQYKICYFIISKSNNYLREVCFFHVTINVLTSQNFKGISPYFILYCALDEHTHGDFVTCSGQVSWTKAV